MTTPEPQPGILDIALYEGGASHAEGVARPVKLSSNENPFGPSEAAKAAFRATADQLHRYPSSDHASLRAAIGRTHDLDPDRIICGVGSDEIFTFLCYAYAGPGDEVIHTSHGFALHRISALAAGATPVEVAERDRVVDVDAILAAANDAHPDRVHRQPRQPHRHAVAGGRPDTSGRRPAAPLHPGPRRRLCRVRRGL